MRRLGMLACLLIFLGSSGCQLTREPKPPRPPEEFRRPPDEARFQTPEFYPKNVLNQDNQIKLRAEERQNGLLNTKSLGRGPGGGGMGGP